MHVLEYLICDDEVKTFGEHVLTNVEFGEIDCLVRFEREISPVMAWRNFQRVEALGTQRGNPVMTLTVCNNPNPMGCIKTDARQ